MKHACAGESDSVQNRRHRCLSALPQITRGDVQSGNGSDVVATDRSVQGRSTRDVVQVSPGKFPTRRELEEMGRAGFANLEVYRGVSGSEACAGDRSHGFTMDGVLPRRGRRFHSRAQATPHIETFEFNERAQTADNGCGNCAFSLDTFHRSCRQRAAFVRRITVIPCKI